MGSSSLNQVRTLSNYGFYVSGNTVDPIFSLGKIDTKPNVSIQGSCLYIDYTHTTNMSDLVYLVKTFKSFTAGVTFYVPPVQYYDGYNNIQTTIGGTAYFTKLIGGNKIILGNIISGFTTPTNYTFFDKQNFIKNIEYNFSSTQSLTGYFLVNSIPGTSSTKFKNLGIIGSRFGFEEYLSFESGGTAENLERIPIDCYAEFKDGREAIYFETGGTAQNLIETFSQIGLYIRGDPDLITAPKSSTIPVVLIVKTTSTASLVACYENQNFNQALLRKNYFDTSNTTPFYAIIDNCSTCIDANYFDPAQGTKSDIGEFFNTLIYIKLINPSTVFTSTSSALNLSTTTVTPITNVNITSTPNTITKIDTSHLSLIGYDLLIYSEPTRTTLLNTNQFEKFGKFGYINSYAMLQNYLSNTTLYCSLQNSQSSASIKFTIKV